MSETITKKKNLLRHRWMMAVKFSVAAGLIAAMVATGWLNVRTLGTALENPFTLMLAALLMFMGLVLTMLRWRILLHLQKIKPALLDVFRLSFIGFFFSNIIPGSVSGDAIKAYYVARDHGDTTPAVTSVLFDRFIGLLTYGITASAAILLFWLARGSSVVFSDPRLVTLCWFILAITAGMILFLAVVLSRTTSNSRLLNWFLDHVPFKSLARRFYEAVSLYRTKKHAIAGVLGISLLAQLAMILATFALGKSLGDHQLGISAYFFLAPVGLVVNSIPITPGGLGTGEVAYQALFAAFGSTAGQDGGSIGAEVAALWHALFFGWGLLGMVFYVQRKKAISSVANAASGEL